MVNGRPRFLVPNCSLHKKNTVASASLRSMTRSITCLSFFGVVGLSLSVSVWKNSRSFHSQYSRLSHFRNLLSSEWSLSCLNSQTSFSRHQVNLTSGCATGIKGLNAGKKQNFLNFPYRIVRSAQHFDLRSHQLSCLISFKRSYSTSHSSSDEIYKEVANMIKCNATNILVMAGAGISTPSGIPDFRTPGTGLYDNLQKYRLPYPEAIFDIHYFMMDPKPFIVLAQELYPGVNYKPNIAHYFIRLLFENQKLQKLYTQNIDGLERMAGIPETKLMEAHGTFATASCTLCNKVYPGEKVKQAILKGEVPSCAEARCKGKVKPDIVFFGENLPMQFWDYHTDVHFTDLLLVMGTSLEVYPFAGIADAVNRQTPRVLINRELVGSFGTRENDYMLLGDLTSSVERLLKAIGWENELENLMKDL